MDERIINIMWTGPYSIIDVRKMNCPTDKGLYQVYGHHPIYGRNLVYIGQTTTSFSDRPAYAKEEERWESGSENDPDRVEYYLGRLMGNSTPSIEEWKRDIKLAEALLIHAHGPAYNNQWTKSPPDSVTHSHIRILNYGSVRSLHREVSGMIWTGGAKKNYRPYGAA